MTPVALAASQMTLSFEPSLPERFTSLRSYVAFRVQEQRLNAAKLASDMDLSPSVLSRKLNQPDGDTQRLNCDDLEAYIKATGDTSPLEYLAAKFLDSPEARRGRMLSNAERLLAELSMVLPSLRSAA
jgi:regulatory protein CII